MNVGDRVRLKSSGPQMVIEEIDGDWASCVWFDKAEVKRGNFPLAALDLE